VEPVVRPGVAPSVSALAILVAAGRGERMGSERPKAFLPLAGEPLLVRAARPFEASPSVGSLVAVVPVEEVENARGLLAPMGKLSAVVAGGMRRQDSVLEGLKQAPDGFDGIVLVHDAARPFVDEALIEAVVRAASLDGAALPVLPLVDTIKRVRDGHVVETLDRAALGAAQTPQGFRMDLLARAYEEAFRDRVTVTDEAAALERIGARVAAVPGSPRNRKITTPEDLAWAEDALARQPVPARA
jgi:2-C-methyl-D-erythritol 4-phosphate cytidylyltransferase